MADKFVEIEIENEERIIHSLERMEERVRGRARETIEDLTNATALTLIGATPMHNTYIMQHIDRDGPVWMPGGAGGGGEWKSIVGIKEGTSRHPIYVEFGTGIYAGRGLIWASGVKGLTGRYQSVMAFKKRGEGEGKWIVRYWTRGQRGQHYFYRTWQILNAVAEARIASRRIIG
jgi:hypothetical protein